MSLKSKIDFAVIFIVKNANPNGDPLNGNRPRTTLDGLGELSDVCVKRKIRDRLCEKGYEIFVQSDDRKTDDCASLRKRAEKAGIFNGKPTKDQIIKSVCEKWIDVRAFGQLFAYSEKKISKKKNETQDDELEEGSDGVSIGIRGPVSIHSAFSISPVNITSIQITKSVNGQGDSGKKDSDTMGMKHRVDRGIYTFYGSISPQLAHNTGFSDEDAEAIKAVLPKLFENDASSARPDGSMRVLKVVWWKHSSRSGQYSSARVHASLQVTDDEQNVCQIHALDGLHPEILDGF
jgi:CRISPR-associated protein Csd2